ncbi:zinc finger, CCHC-type containing protein [Tanacetum coccineum]
MRIVLSTEQKLNHLEEALHEAPPDTATAAVRNAYTCRELKTMFQQQAEQELFETVKAFHACKQEEGKSIRTYMLKKKGYLDQMERLGYVMPLLLGVNLILTSLLKDYNQFVQNYNMHSMEKTIPELHDMLKLAEKCIPRKALTVLAIRKGHIQKPKSQARGKGKNKGKSKLANNPKHKIPPPTKKEHLAKDTLCHRFYQLGHWRRNCPFYLAELKKSKARTFGLRGIRKLNKGALDMYVGNGNCATVEAIGSFDLILPSGMVLVLDNFQFSPSITRGDILFYFNAIPHDGIFEIAMHNYVSNERSIYTCSNKKSKRNLDSTFLWHCRLGHINKKRIAKLQQDGLVKWINNESFNVIKIALSLSSCSLGLGLGLCYRLVPSRCVIFDLKPLSLSFDFVFNSDILKSFSLRSLPSCDLVSWYRRDHIGHHLESLLTISLDNLCLDNLNIFKDLEYQSCKSLCLCLILSFLDS